MMNDCVLVIEDHAPLRENIAEVLEMAGYRVLTTANGKTGLRLAQKELPDLILCDVLLPQMNGYQVFSVLRKDAPTSGIPFIFMTGHNNETDIPYSTRNKILAKPFDTPTLLQTVQNRINQSKNHGTGTDRGKIEHIEMLEHILNSISHELRNPICTSLGLASLLDQQAGKKNNHEEVQRIIDGIKANATRLENITGTLTEVVYQAIKNYKENMI